jgi:Family of unknown function (DUF6174)
MKSTIALVVMMLLQAAPTPPHVDIIQAKDPAISLLPGGSSPSGLPAASPYAVTLRNNSTHDITGLVVEWLAGGPPTTLLLDGGSLKRPVVPAKGMFTLMPPHDIKPVNTDQSGRVIPGAPGPDTAVTRVVIEVASVLFEDGTLIGRDGLDRYGLVANMKAKSEVAEAEAKWVAKKPDVYEFTYKRNCFCPPPPPGKPGSEPIVFRVLNGIGYLLGAWAERPEAVKGLAPYSTVEKQFEFIRQELNKHPYEVTVEFDPDDGHPTHVRFNLEHIADADYGFTATGFTRLER